MAWLAQCDVCGGGGFFCSHRGSNPDLNQAAIAGTYQDAGPATVQEFQFFGRHGDGIAWLAEDAKSEEVASETWANPPMVAEKLNMWDDDDRRGSCSYQWPAVDSCFMSASSGTAPSTDTAAVGLTPCVSTTEHFYGYIDCSSADATETDKAPPSSKDEGGSMDREARVRRYREKKKRRQFGKQVRYESRKAYAESRPRVRGRFIKTSSEGAIRAPSPPLPPPQRDADQFGVGWYRAFGP